MRRPGPREDLGSRSEVAVLAGSLPVSSHRLQYLISIVERVGARILYLIDHLLRCIVVLDLRNDLILAGREVQVWQVLLELSQVEITQVAQIAKAHVLVPLISLSNDFKYSSTHYALCQINTAVV